MLKKYLFILLAIALLFAPAALAQDGNPTIAILRFGNAQNEDFSSSETGVLDLLEAHAYISADERAGLAGRASLAGENINIIWGDAAFEFINAAIAVDNALDQGADALVTIGTPVTLVAANTTLDMDDPPAILFTAVHNSYEAGIAQSSCIKPAHVTGSEIRTSYAYVFEALQKQNPALAVIGTIYDTASASGIFGVDQIMEYASELGISVEAAGATSLADLRAAAESLAQKGAEAIVLPIDNLTTQGLPIIVTIANEKGLPVFHPSLGSIYFGATIGAGYSHFYENGVHAGTALAAHLNGDIDIATTGIHIATGGGLGINLDSANLQGVDVSSELMDEADVVLEGGKPSRISARVMQRIRQRGIVIPLEERQASDMEHLASLQCTDEMIAEQQAALDAAS